jgi:hypothetical protein
MLERELTLDTKDYQGRRIVLTTRTFRRHIPIHPEITDYLREADEAISDPDGVIELESGASFLYRYGLGRTLFSNTYLGVVVHYKPEGTSERGVVATFHLPKGRVARIRYQWIAGARIAVEGI